MANTYNPTTVTWQQVANKQAYEMAQSGNFNSETMITEYDPIYNKLIMQITYTMYRKLQYIQRWRNIGRNAPENAYPGILREIAMRVRKGQNFPFDNGTKPTTLNSYAIIDDEIVTRYHAAQFRWMYGYTIYDEILRAYGGGSGMTIRQLAEMKAMGAISARNMFMDSLRKETLNNYIGNAAVQIKDLPDISDPNITQADAKAFLNFVRNVLFEMENGTALYNGEKITMQTPKADLQMLIPQQYFYNVMEAAFPDTISQTRYFENILPENLVLLDTFGGDGLTGTDGNLIVPTFDDNGINQLTWTEAGTFTAGNPDVMCVIMHRDCIGFEDNLDRMLFAPKDIEKLATAARMHFWTKAYYTDLLPGVVMMRKEPTPVQPGEDGG